MKKKGKAIVVGQALLTPEERVLYLAQIDNQPWHAFEGAFNRYALEKAGVDIEGLSLYTESLPKGNELNMKNVKKVLTAFNILSKEKAERLWDLPIDRSTPLSVPQVLEDLHRDWNPELLVTNFVGKVVTNDNKNPGVPSSQYSHRLDLESHFGDGAVGSKEGWRYLQPDDPFISSPKKVSEFFRTSSVWLKALYDIALRRTHGESLTGSDYVAIRKAFGSFKEAAVKLPVATNQPYRKSLLLSYLWEDYLMVADLKMEPLDMSQEVIDFFAGELGGQSKLMGLLQSELLDLTEGYRASQRFGMNYFRNQRESLILYLNLFEALKILKGLDDGFLRRLAKLDEKLNFYNRKLRNAGSPEFKRQFFLATLMAFQALGEVKDPAFLDYLGSYFGHGNFRLGEDHVIRQKTEFAKAIGAIVCDYLARLERTPWDMNVRVWALLFGSERVSQEVWAQIFKGASEAEMKQAIDYAQYVYDKDVFLHGGYEAAVPGTPKRNIKQEYESRKAKGNKPSEAVPSVKPASGTPKAEMKPVTPRGVARRGNFIVSRL